MNHAEVLRRFAEQVPNRRTGDASWRGANVFSKGRAVFSYGHHFPLAYLLGERHGARLFLKNGDRYSSTTSKHQGLTQQTCPGPTVSFATLEQAGVDPAQVSLQASGGSCVILVNWQEDTWTDLQRKDVDSPWCLEYGPDEGKVFERPAVGMLILHSRGPALRASWHILGAALLLVLGGEGADLNPYSSHAIVRYLLCARDEGTYFIAELSSPASTVAEAIEGLKPEAVKKAEAAGITVVRQGEWFAVPYSTLTDRDVAALVGVKTLRELRQRGKQGALPRRFIPEPLLHPGGFRQVGAEHVLPYVVTPRAVFFGRGCMYHRSERGGRRNRPDHRMLRLGAVWHQIERNTERQSWSGVSGRVD